MDIGTYNSIIGCIRNYRGLSKNCFQLLKGRFPNINEDTLFSIISHEYRKRMRYNHGKSVEVMEKYYNLYKEATDRDDKPGIILRIAELYDVTPCLVAKLILQRYYLKQGMNIVDDESNTQINIKMHLRDPNLIQDPKLSYEIYLCTLYDDQYSPIVEMMRTSLGQEYEIKLHRELAKLGLAFRDEEYLRKYGYDKTPDVKLEVPVAIDGFVINWVESKALFGDEFIHREHMRNQYLSYWNRFGPGLVIYWFGFVETILQGNDKRLIIRDHFPSNIIHIMSPKSTKNQQ